MGETIFYVLIAANVLASFQGFQNESFFRKYEFHIASIRTGEKWRMLSSAFLHVDIAHLAFNMITFYFFAPMLYQTLSVFSFLLIYFGSLLGGSLLSLWYHQNEPYYRAVGASGAVSGIIYGTIMLYPELDLYLFFIPIPIPAYIFGVGYLVYSIYGMKNSIGNVGHTAHLGGAISGFLVLLVQYPSIIFQNTLMFGLLLIPILMLFFLLWKEKK
ncbi:MAG: rhomboid family intramembrane serine protease [Flavobacterium sp.]